MPPKGFMARIRCGRHMSRRRPHTYASPALSTRKKRCVQLALRQHNPDGIRLLFLCVAMLSGRRPQSTKLACFRLDSEYRKTC
eukprot:scaffold28520_cov124-Isochrysis_galbana.AAC.7